MVVSTCTCQIYGGWITFARNQFDAPKYMFTSKGTLLYQHFLCHRMCEDCTKNLLFSVIFHAFLLSVWAIESVWQRGKFWMSFFFFFCHMKTNFDPDIKVLRSYSNETSWMASGVPVNWLTPKTLTIFFHQRPVQQAFLFFLFVLVFQLVVKAYKWERCNQTHRQ